MLRIHPAKYRRDFEYEVRAWVKASAHNSILTSIFVVRSRAMTSSKDLICKRYFNLSPFYPTRNMKSPDQMRPVQTLDLTMYVYGQILPCKHDVNE